MDKRRGGKRGRNNGRRKLSDDAVLAIRGYCERNGYSLKVCRVLCEKYGVGAPTIYSIATGMTHAYLVLRGPVTEPIIGPKRFTTWRVLSPRER